MSKKIIIANWKMNLSAARSLEFIEKVNPQKQKVVIAAPFTFLCQLGKHLKNKKIGLAAQNVSQFAEGAYTGDVSAKMIKDQGCKYCLVGHSERRIYFKETDEQINQKIRQLLENKIKPVLCIGETAEQRDKKMTKEVLKRQLSKALKGIKNPDGLLVAYEPVWAISTFQKGKIKKAAQIREIKAAHLQIRRIINKLYRSAKNYKIIYGGTVNPENAAEILNSAEVAGALVGGASLKVSSLNAIIDSIK
jgi:triosephosphate isomerase